MTVNRKKACLSILVALALLFLGTIQLPVTTCELQTLGNVGASIQAGSVSAYDVILGGWQAVFGATLGSGRMFSIVCFILTLAVVYRFAEELLCSQPQAIQVTVLVAAAGTASILLTTSTHYAWLTLLSVLSTWLLWRVRHSGGNYRLAAPALYGVSIVLSLSSHWVLSVVILFHLVYLLSASRQPLVLVLLLAAALMLVFVVEIRSANSILLPAQDTPPLLLGLLAIGVATVLVGLFDSLSQRPFGDNGRRRHQHFIALWLLTPLVTTVFIGAPEPIMALVLLIPASMAIIHALSTMSLRAQAMTGLLIAAWLLPYGSIADGQAVRNDIHDRTGNNSPIIIDMSGPCFKQSGILGALYDSHTGSPMYIHLDGAGSGSQWAALSSTGAIRLADGAPLLSAEPEYWTIEAANPSDTSNIPIPGDANLLYQRNYGPATLRHFSRQPVETISPDHEVIYRVGALALLKFNVLPETTVAPGTTLLFNSWWTAPDAVDDNYLIKVELLDSQSASVTYSTGLVAKTYSSTWERRTVHYDQQALTIPDDLPLGPYSLIITMHGSTNPNNLPFVGTDGASSGAYAYLTTINIVR